MESVATSEQLTVANAEKNNTIAFLTAVAQLAAPQFTAACNVPAHDLISYIQHATYGKMVCLYSKARKEGRFYTIPDAGGVEWENPKWTGPTWRDTWDVITFIPGPNTHGGYILFYTRVGGAYELYELQDDKWGKQIYSKRGWSQWHSITTMRLGNQNYLLFKNDITSRRALYTITDDAKLKQRIL